MGLARNDPPPYPLFFGSAIAFRIGDLVRRATSAIDRVALLPAVVGSAIDRER
jgi:hypothetical protein